MRVGPFRGHIPINECLAVLIIDYQVKVAVTIKVAICCSVAETWRIKAKRYGFIFKLKVLLVDKAITGNRRFRHFVEERFRFKAAAFYLAQYFLAAKISEEILVC